MSKGDILMPINECLDPVWADIKIINPPRLKRDWKGKRVRSIRIMQNGWGIIPSGTIFTIEKQNNYGSQLLSDKCPNCGAQIRISQVKASDIEFIEYLA